MALVPAEHWKRAMRVLPWSGIAAPIVYLAAVASGEGGATAALLALCSLLLGGFALGLWLRLRRAHPAFWFAAAALGDICLFGLLLLAFPGDPSGVPTTLGGMVHLLLVGLAALWALLAIGAMALGWRAVGSDERARADLLLFALVLACGLLATLDWPLADAGERLAIGAFLGWVALTAVRLLREPPSP